MYYQILDGLRNYTKMYQAIQLAISNNNEKKTFEVLYTNDFNTLYTLFRTRVHQTAGKNQ